MSNKKVVPVLVLAAAAAAAAIVLATRRSGTGGPGARSEEQKPVALRSLDEPPLSSAWLDVHDPKKLFAAAEANGWLKQALAEPLGEGFVGTWAGFLGSRGEDLKADFRGTLAGAFAQRLLADPFRVVWYAGHAASGQPAVVLPHPSAPARGALAALVAATQRGTVTLAHCPRPGEKRGRGEQGYGDPAARERPPDIVLARLVAAGRSIYQGEREGRLVLAANPVAAAQGLCAEPPPVARAAGTDLDLSFSRDGLGREAQTFFALLGVAPSPRLSFAVEGNALVPRGIAAELAVPGRLDAAATPESLLRLVPEETGVVLTLALQLPQQLSAATLKAHFGGAGSTAATRQAVILWNPRGDAKLPSEIGLAWSSVADQEGLRQIFSGRNPIQERRICGHLVLASSEPLLARMARACEGKAPSILSAPAPVAAGLRAPASVGLGVNLGRVLSQLVGDAYAAEAASGALGSPGGGRAPARPEIESARRLLEDLPFMGWRGVKRDRALVPGGYRS